MKKLIGVVDLCTGVIKNRRQETLTLDIPADLDWQTGGVSVDPQRIVRYFGAAGTRRLYIGQFNRLSQRPLGEECLVADEATASEGATSLRRYRLSVVSGLD